MGFFEILKQRILKNPRQKFFESQVTSAGGVLSCSNSTERCYTTNFFKIFFLRAGFRTFFEKNLWWSLFIIDLQFARSRLATLQKQILERESLKFESWEFSQSIVFRNIFVCVKELNYMKHIIGKSRLLKKARLLERH